MKRILIGALALLVAASAPASAQTYRAETRENRQESRTVRGVLNGDLTRGETRKIVRQQNRIDRTQARAARDGYVSRREQRRIERQQDRASRNIARKTRNNRTAY